jgi:hypothetical protein
MNKLFRHCEHSEAIQALQCETPRHKVAKLISPERAPQAFKKPPCRNINFLLKTPWRLCALVLKFKNVKLEYKPCV